MGSLYTLSDLGELLEGKHLTFKDNLKLGTVLFLSKGYLMSNHPNISDCANDAMNTYLQLSKLMAENPSLLNDENGKLTEPIFKSFMGALSSIKASFTSLKENFKNLQMVKYFSKETSPELKSSRVGPHGTDPLTPRYVRCRIPRFQTGV